jgi:AraC-like DNA-binding protein
MAKHPAPGRPKKLIDEAQLRALMRMKPTLKDTAAFFECSEDTIEKRCKEIAGVNFTEFREQNMVHTRLSLVRKAIQKAEGGDNTMLIFCLKNLCDWKDKQPEEVPSVTVNLGTKTDEELDQIILQAAAEIKSHKKK